MRRGRARSWCIQPPTLGPGQRQLVGCEKHLLCPVLEAVAAGVCERHVGGTTTAAVARCRQCCGNVGVIGKGGYSDGVEDGHALDAEREWDRAAALVGWRLLPALRGVAAAAAERRQRRAARWLPGSGVMGGHGRLQRRLRRGPGAAERRSRAMLFAGHQSSSPGPSTLRRAPGKFDEFATLLRTVLRRLLPTHPLCPSLCCLLAIA